MVPIEILQLSFSSVFSEMDLLSTNCVEVSIFCTVLGKGSDNDIFHFEAQKRYQVVYFKRKKKWRDI